MKKFCFYDSFFSDRFLFFSQETPKQTLSEKEIAQRTFHEKLTDLSEGISQDQVRNFLRSDACDVMFFESLKNQSFWSPEWNTALARALGQETLSSTSIQKIQKALGSFLSRKILIIVYKTTDIPQKYGLFQKFKIHATKSTTGV